MQTRVCARCPLMRMCDPKVGFSSLPDLFGQSLPVLKILLGKGQNSFGCIPFWGEGGGVWLVGPATSTPLLTPFTLTIKLHYFPKYRSKINNVLALGNAPRTRLFKVINAWTFRQRPQNIFPATSLHSNFLSNQYPRCKNQSAARRGS